MASTSLDIDPRLRAPPAIVNRTISSAGPPSLQTHASSPHQTLYPHPSPYANTPQSASHSSDHRGDSDGAQDDDPKRPRACEACRGLKVRCEPDPGNVTGPCKRCAKARRNCVVTAPSRKRQKKTDSRVADLEKKLDDLKAALEAKAALVPVSSGSGNDIQHENTQNQHQSYQQVTNGLYGARFTGRPDARMSGDWSAHTKPPDSNTNRKQSTPLMVIAGQKRRHAETRESAVSPDARSSSTAGQPRASDASAYPFCSKAVGRAPQTHEYADVIDRGLITMDTATQMFTCYVERMAIHMPSVVFTAGTTAGDIRKTKPILFLAILAAASNTSYPHLQRTLTKEVMSIYADRVICNGDKTLEIIQALHISTLWYWPPEHFEELKFYQLIHIAAVMAIDIGMGKRSNKSKKAGLFRDHHWRRDPHPDSESIEARRSWLSCYFLCCNASMGLRRPNLIRWTQFMADSVEVLETSPEAAHSDKSLCQWVRSQHIAEEIGLQFSMDDPIATVSIADKAVQYALKGFERDLAQWSSRIPADVDTPVLRMTEHVVNLYMHEVAMHVNHNVDEFKPPFSEAELLSHEDPKNNKQEALTHNHIAALSTCLTSIDGIFITFLSFDVDTIRCLPVAHFVRVGYAVVVLIKMYFAATTPNSELGKVINKENMKVEQYLDGLVDLFKASAAEEKSRPSAKFLMVLIMLKTWFYRQREGNQPSREATLSTGLVSQNGLETLVANPSETDQRLSTQSLISQKGYSQPNTPLQLLSEVATHDSAQALSASSGTLNKHASPAAWQSQQQYQNYDGSTNQMGGYNSNMDPALGFDALGSTMGDGLEQAMGFTLGVGDFAAYFNDDTLFNSLMGSVGSGDGGRGMDGF